MDYSKYETLLFEKRDRVLTVTLNRPEKLNAINGPMHVELSHVFEDINRDRSVDIVILTGAGRAFCAGCDADWLQELIDDPWGWETLSEEGKRSMMSILDCRQPVIAKLNGAAAGLGATLALYCDVIMAADTARIGDPAREGRPDRGRRRVGHLALPDRLRARPANSFTPAKC